MQQFRQFYAERFARTKQVCMIGSSFLSLDGDYKTSGRIDLKKGRMVEFIHEGERQKRFVVNGIMHRDEHMMILDSVFGPKMVLVKEVPVIVGHTKNGAVDFLTDCFERGLFSVTYDGKGLIAESMEAQGFYVKYGFATSFHMETNNIHMLAHNNAAKLQQAIQITLKNGEHDSENVTIPICVSLKGEVIAKIPDEIMEDHFVFMVLYDKRTKRIVESSVDREYGDDLPSKADESATEILEASMDLYNVLPKGWAK